MGPVAGLRRFVVAILLALLLPTALAAGRLTADDVIFLLQRGTDQAEIQRMVRDADPLEIDEGDLEQIRGAGAGPELIAEIRDRVGTGAGAVTVASVTAMLRQGVPEADVLEAILAGGRRFFLDTATVLELRRSGASPEIIAALEGAYVRPGFRVYRHPLGFLSIQYPAEWHEYEWHTRDGLVTVLSPEPGITAHDRFTMGLSLRAVPLVAPWRDDPRTPYLTYTVAKAQLLALAGGPEVERDDGPTGVREPAGVTRPDVPGGCRAVGRSFTCTVAGARCQAERLSVALGGPLYAVLEFVAPAEKSEELSPLMAQMMATFRAFPGEAAPTRLDRPLRTSDIVDRFREAVVQIRAEFPDGRTGFGSGFFVRGDGYILTNHHVICGRERHEDCGDPSNWVLPSSISIQWDRLVEPEQPGEEQRVVRGVELVNTVYSAFPHADLALLKAAPAGEEFSTFRLSQVADGTVYEGDPVAALGFPLPDRFAAGSLFATEGIISRINYAERLPGGGRSTRRADDLLTTAEIQSGNSGGPLIDLATGTAIGLNTYVPLVRGSGGELKELDYFGVIPVDHAIRYFPEIRRYPRGRRMMPQDHVELGTYLYALGMRTEATHELDLAARDGAELTTASRAGIHYARALICEDEGEASLAELDKCLELDPAHLPALRRKAKLLLYTLRREETIGLWDEALRLSPDDFWATYGRAQACRDLGRPADAMAGVERCLDLLAAPIGEPYTLRGQVLEAQGRPDEAREAYAQALAVDPGHFLARIELGYQHWHADRLAGAQAEFARAVDEHPNEPAAHRFYGYFLWKKAEGREEEALGHFLQAVALTADANRRPDGYLLNDIMMLVLDCPGHAGVNLALARIRARFYPDDLADIMGDLLNYWQAHYVVTSLDCPVTVDGKVVAHLQPPDMVECLAVDEENCYTAIAIDGRTVRAAVPLAAVRPMAGAVSAAHNAWEELDHSFDSLDDVTPDEWLPLSPQELVPVVTEGIAPELLRACLRETSINAVLPVELLAGLAQEAGWAPWQTMAVLERYLDDQMIGGPALASLVHTQLQEESVHWGETSPYGTYSFSNTGNVPLTGIMVRRTYLDKDENVLWRSEVPLRTGNPVLAAGASVDLEYHYDDYEALRRAGVDTDDVSFVRLKAVSARNALALQSLKIEIVEQTAAGAAIRVINPTLFAVTNPQFRVFYEDGSGHPVLHRDTGRPVTSPVLTLRETIGSGETSGRLSLGEYATVAGARRLGIPYSTREVLPVIRCVDCQLSLP